MKYTDEQIAKVRRANPVVAVIGQHATLTAGNAPGFYVGPNPMCSNRGELQVDAQMDLWYAVCGCCDMAGDAIDFMRKLRGLDFAQAVGDLAFRAAIKLVDAQANTLP